MLSRVAPVEMLRPIANSTMKMMTRASRACAFVTKYKANIGPINSVAEIATLKTLTSQTKERSSK